jgi:methionyl-tRNA formyltransferase
MRKVLMLGIGPTAMSALDSLTKAFQVVGVVRQAMDSAEGEDEVVRRARALDVPVLPDVSARGVDRAISETQPDCVVASSYNRILDAKILDRCRFVNVHYAPLPRYRGRTFLNWAIVNGEPEFAITIHAMTSQLDAGNILYQEAVTLGPHDTAWDLMAALNEIQRAVLGDAVARYLDGYEGEPQNDSGATYACQRVPADGEIDWSQPTERVYALVRALPPPWPPAFTYLETRRIGIARALPVRDAPRYAGRVPGRIVHRSRTGGFVDVLTGDGLLRIHEVITGDGPPVPAASVITSTRQTLGLRPAALLARIEELERRLDSLAGKGNQS